MKYVDKITMNSPLWFFFPSATKLVDCLSISQMNVLCFEPWFFHHRWLWNSSNIMFRFVNHPRVSFFGFHHNSLFFFFVISATVCNLVITGRRYGLLSNWYRRQFFIHFVLKTTCMMFQGIRIVRNWVIVPSKRLYIVNRFNLTQIPSILMKKICGSHTYIYHPWTLSIFEYVLSKYFYHDRHSHCSYGCPAKFMRRLFLRA